MVSQIKVDSILESSSGNGVTIDGSLIKDGSVAGIMEEVDQWVNTGNITSSQNPITTWARPSGLLLPLHRS